MRPGASRCAGVLVVGETTAAAGAHSIVHVDAGGASSCGEARGADCCPLLHAVVVREPEVQEDCTASRSARAHASLTAGRGRSMRSVELLSSAIIGSALAATSRSVGERARENDALSGTELAGCAGADVCSAICVGRQPDKDDSRDCGCANCCKFACDELDSDGRGVGAAAGLVAADFVAARVAG